MVTFKMRDDGSQIFPGDDDAIYEYEPHSWIWQAAHRLRREKMAQAEAQRQVRQVLFLSGLDKDTTQQVARSLLTSLPPDNAPPAKDAHTGHVPVAAALLDAPRGVPSPTPSGPTIWLPTSPTLADACADIVQEPLHIYCGVAAIDIHHYVALFRHLTALRSTKTVSMCSNFDVPAGVDYRTAMRQNIDSADLVVLLLSADYIYELDRDGTLQRLERKPPPALLVPILVRPVDIEGTFLSQLSSLPTGGPAITSWTNIDEAWFEVARGIRGKVEHLREPGVVASRWRS